MDFLEDPEKVLKGKDGITAFCCVEEDKKCSDLRFKKGAGGGRPQDWGHKLWGGLFHISGLFGFPQECWDGRNPQLPSTP